MKLLILLFILISSAYSQEVIQTGRPGQSIGTSIIPMKRFQLQSGLEYNEVEVENKLNTNLINNNVIRTGLSEKLEASILFDLNELNANEMQTQNLQVGGRIRILTGKLNLIFQTRVQLINFDAKINKKFKVNNILAAVYDLGDNGSLTSNLIFNNFDEDTSVFNAYTLNWGISFHEKWNTFIEYYSNKSEDNWVSAWDTGLGYLVHNDLMLDFSFGQDLDDDIDSQFISLGFSYRI